MAQYNSCTVADEECVAFLKVGEDVDGAKGGYAQWYALIITHSNRMRFTLAGNANSAVLKLGPK